MMIRILIALAVTLTAGLASASPILDVVETPGDYYTITAQDSADPSVKYWQVKVDITSGALYSFIDYTDAGDGSGGHTNYMGASGYSRKCSLVQFYGRGGQVLSRNGSVGGIADRMSFTAAPDGSSFTITYTEDATSADYFQDAYGSDVRALTPGDLLTTITVTIRPPTSEGTFWDWSVSQENVSDHQVDARVWAKQSVRANLLGSIPRTIDNEGTKTDGPWNEAAPVSFARQTIDSNTLGLVVGRKFVLDFQAGLEDIVQLGANPGTGSWAGYEYLEYFSPYTTNMSLSQAPGTTRVEAGQLIINIDTSSANAPTAFAGADISVNDTDGDDVETVTLDGSGSSTPAGTAITDYEWKNGISTLGTTANIDVTLPVGVHTLTLTVTNDLGLTSTDDVDVEVVGAPSEFADAGADQVILDADDNGSQTATLDGSASAWSVTAWNWTEGGSEIAVGEMVDVDLAVGVHTITLTCTDIKGNTDSDDVVIEILDGSPRPPVADAGSDRTVYDSDSNNSEVVTLNGTGSSDLDGTIVSYQWDEGGSVIGTGAQPQVTLAMGSHLITLMVTDDDGMTDTDTVTITVAAQPGFEPFPQPDPNCGLPETVPVDTTGNQLFNTYGQSMSGSVPTDLIWPTNHGDADICLYKDDKFAAASITVDDHNWPDVPWWRQQIDLHDFKMTWFVINQKFRDYGLFPEYLYGWYSDYAALYEEGHDIHSHSMTHHDNEHLFTTCELHYEYGKSIELIEEKIPGSKCETLGYPWGEGRATVASQYFIAVRGVGGGINRPYNTDYFNTKNASTNVQVGTDILLTGTGNISWSNPIYKRGWANFMYHGVGDKTNAASQIQYLMDRRDQVWVCKFSEMAKYGQQRDTATLTVSNVTPMQVTLNVTDRMMDSIYNYPLTVKVRVNNDWNEVNALQGGQATDAEIITHDGDKYVLVQVVPDAGNVVLSSGPAGPSVVNRAIFYNGSSFDGGDPTANTSDDAAIAADKQALLPGQIATLINYTSYDQGINGIMVDIDGLAGTLSASDFEFKAGNDSSPGAWSNAAAPGSLTVRPGAGVGGSDRVTLIWSSEAVRGQWLQVTVKANANTGLASDDVFYFGNAVGETGNSAVDAIVDATDEIAARNNPRTFLRPAAIDDLHDFNRDGKVDATDQIIIRNNVTTMATDLELISP